MKHILLHLMFTGSTSFIQSEISALTGNLQSNWIPSLYFNLTTTLIWLSGLQAASIIIPCFVISSPGMMMVECWVSAFSSCEHYNCCGVGSHVSACHRCQLGSKHNRKFSSISWQPGVSWEVEPTSPGQAEQTKQFVKILLICSEPRPAPAVEARYMFSSC